MHFLHSKGCAHRDLKLENVVVDHDFTLKIMVRYRQNIGQRPMTLLKLFSLCFSLFGVILIFVVKPRYLGLDVRKTTSQQKLKTPCRKSCPDGQRDCPKSSKERERGERHQRHFVCSRERKSSYTKDSQDDRGKRRACATESDGA